MNAERWNIDDAAYYADKEWLSHSDWKLFARSPSLYERHCIKGVPIKPNASMEFGNMVDACVFHRDGFAAKVAIAPQDVLSKRGTRQGRKFQEWAAQHEGRVILTHKDPLANVLEAIAGHEEAMGVFNAEGESQPAIRWESTVDGITVKRKAKLDKLPNDLSFLADLKTTRDPSPESFAKDIINFGYHTQAVWYQDAVEAISGVRPPFLIVAVQNCEPYDVEVYKLNDAFLELGRRKIDAKLSEFVACRLANRWRKPTHGQVIELAPPFWAEKQLTDWNLSGSLA